MADQVQDIHDKPKLAPTRKEQLQKKSFRQVAQEKLESQQNKPKLAPQPVQATPKEEIKVDPAAVVEAEKITEEPKVQPIKTDTIVPVIDEEKLADSFATKFVEKTREIESNQKTTEEQKKQEMDALKVKFSKQTKDGKTIPASWEEIVEEGRRLGFEDAKRWYTEQEQTKAKKAQEEQTKVQSEKQAQQDRIAGWDDFNWSELEDLGKQGKIPQIKVRKDEKDPGSKVALDLLGQMYRHNQTLQAQNKPIVMSPKVFFYEHYKAPNAQPAGADAPVAGAAPVSSRPSTRLTRDQLRQMSYQQLAKQISLTKQKQKQS